jgi:hypothetical protein
MEKREGNKMLKANRLLEYYFFAKKFFRAVFALSGKPHSFATQSRKRG